MGETENRPEQAQPAPLAEAPPAGPRSFLSVAWPYALILAIGILVLMPKLGEFGFWDPWEPKYAETVREMYEEDSLIVPYYRHEVRLTKPILVYWGIMAGSAVFGLNEFGARIAGVAMAIGTMLSVFYVVSKLRGRQAGLLAALVLGTAPHFYFISRQAMPDVYLFTSVGGCLLFFSLGIFGPAKRRNPHFGISYACIALAVLAKGPVIVGTIFLTTLAIYGVILLDPRKFIQPDLRGPTARFISIGLPASLLMVASSFTTFLFGTSSNWWSYNEEGREAMGGLRTQIAARASRLHMDDVLLLVLAVGAVACAFLVAKRWWSRGKLPKAGAVLLALGALVAVVTLVTGGTDSKLFAASALMTVTGAATLAWETSMFLRRPALWPHVQPWIKPVALQLALFVVVFLVVAGPWHIGVFLEEDNGYFTDFIIKHNVKRASDTINRSGVSEFYLRTLIFGFFPWSCFIPIAFASLVDWRDRNPFKRYGLETFMTIAAVVTFAAFTVSATKFGHYLAPIMVPVAVLVGLVISRTLDARHTVFSRLTWIVAAMLFILPSLDLMDDGGIKYLVGSFTMKRYVPTALEPGSYYEALLAGIFIFMLVSVLIRSRVVVGALFVCSTLLANYTTAQFIPALSVHKTMKNLCETWRPYRAEGARIGFYGELKHGIYFYTDYEIKRLVKPANFHEFMEPSKRAFSIVEKKHVPALDSSYRKKYPEKRLHVADRSHFKYILISNFKLEDERSRAPTSRTPTKKSEPAGR